MYHRQYIGGVAPAEILRATFALDIPGPADFDTQGYKLTAIPESDWSDIREVVSIPGEWESVRLISIKPGGMIHLHTDPRPDGQAVTTRYHIVLATNPYCWNYHDGSVQHLKLGGVYTVDELVNHASVNWGMTTRVHMVIDTCLA